MGIIVPSVTWPEGHRPAETTQLKRYSSTKALTKYRFFVL